MHRFIDNLLTMQAKIVKNLTLILTLDSLFLALFFRLKLAKIRSETMLKTILNENLFY